MKLDGMIRDYRAGLIHWSRLTRLEKALCAVISQAQEQSKGGYVQHVNCVVVGSDITYLVSDWYDSDTTVISFENGEEL